MQVEGDTAAFVPLKRFRIVLIVNKSIASLTFGRWESYNTNDTYKLNKKIFIFEIFAMVQ